MERQNNGPPKDICVPIPRVCECLFYMYKRERERLYKYNEKPWNGYNPALVRLAQYNHKGSYKRRKQDCQISEGEIMAETSFSDGLTGFQSGREGPWAKRCKLPVETGKGKELDSSLDALKGRIPW